MQDPDIREGRVEKKCANCYCAHTDKTRHRQTVLHTLCYVLRCKSSTLSRVLEF